MVVVQGEPRPHAVVGGFGPVEGRGPPGFAERIEKDVVEGQVGLVAQGDPLHGGPRGRAEREAEVLGGPNAGARRPV